VIGTAFYALGVIVCMIVIVLIAVAVFGATFVLLRMAVPLIGFLAMVALAWWLGLKSILLLGGFAAIIGGMWWLAQNNERGKTQAFLREQKERWAALDKNWNRE
jgi:hypothetical protein